MIKDIGTYYLYRHIRLDTNEPFYIGIGTKTDCEETSKFKGYNRAYSNKRKTWWKNIVAKTDYEVEILLESDDLNFIKQKEIEFIKLYGRRDLGEGTLVNLTDGGDGTHRRLYTETQKDRFKLGNNPMSKKVINTETEKVYNSAKEAYFEENIDVSLHHFYSIMNGSYYNKYPLKYQNSTKKFKKGREVIDTITKQVFVSLKEAAFYNNISVDKLNKYLTGIYNNTTDLMYYSDFIEGKPKKVKIGKNKVRVLDLKSGKIHQSIKDLSEESGISYASLWNKLSGASKNNTCYIIINDETVYE